MKNKILLTSNHPNAKRAQYFLNSIDEELHETPLNWQRLKRSECIEDGFRFVSNTEVSISITILLCDSYSDAEDVATANDFTFLPTAKWGLNGDILYFVESLDSEKVSTVSGIFAGKE